jgi:hypothetical protein
MDTSSLEVSTAIGDLSGLPVPWSGLARTPAAAKLGSPGRAAVVNREDGALDRAALAARALGDAEAGRGCLQRRAHQVDQAAHVLVLPAWALIHGVVDGDPRVGIGKAKRAAGGAGMRGEASSASGADHRNGDACHLEVGLSGHPGGRRRPAA